MWNCQGPLKGLGVQGLGVGHWAQMGLSEERPQGKHCKRRRQGYNMVPVFHLRNT